MASGTQTNARKQKSCPKCGSPAIRWGRDRDLNQRHKCKGPTGCGITFADPPARPLAPMRIPQERATLCLTLLVEGSSVRAVERITGTHRDTVCRLLKLVGDKMGRFMVENVRDVPVNDVELDEIWSYTGCKQGTLNRRGIYDPERGDVWSFLAVERNTKMIMAHQTGDRDTPTCHEFIERLDGATDGHFQLSCDGWNGYPDIIVEQLGMRVDAAQLIKEYGQAPEEERRKYSPPSIIASEKKPFHGQPDETRICTSIVERTNLSVRTFNKRMSRLTCAFSKKRANHTAAISLFVAHFNFCRIHRSIRMTPALKAGVTDRLWTMADLIAA